MVFDITHLKRVRKHLDLTQHQFAKLAGTSQSMIAKIEAGRLDPTYSYVKKIEIAISRSTRQQEGKQAKDIMHKGIISVSKHQKIMDVLGMFTKHGISQIPVLEKGNVAGLLSESYILKNIGNAQQQCVQDIMEEAPPVVSLETNIKAIISLLQFFPIILVQAKGELVGVITKADVLRSLSAK